MITLMKKILSSISAAATYLVSSTTALAQNQNIRLDRPKIDNKPVGYGDISDFITKSIQLVFIVAIVVVFIMLVWGGLQWILSGGEKEAVGEARRRIVNALIGLAILAVAFAITQVAGTFLGINIFGNLPIPTPS